MPWIKAYTLPDAEHPDKLYLVNTDHVMWAHQSAISDKVLVLHLAHPIDNVDQDPATVVPRTLFAKGSLTGLALALDLPDIVPAGLE